MSEEKDWDQRYARSERIWSGHPNVVLAREADGLTPGTALDLGCGEGADAVWLARRGWRVTGVDISGVAVQRAAAHAEEAGVADRADFQRRDLGESFPDGTYDLVSAQFLHSQGPLPRMRVLARAAAAVAPGGILLVEGHQDHGPFHHDGPPVVFMAPQDVVTGLGLDGPGWELLLCDTHERTQTGPDGEPARRTDSTIKARRRVA